MSQIMFNGIAHAGSMQQLAENYLNCRLQKILHEEGIGPQGIYLRHVRSEDLFFLRVHVRALCEIVTKVALLVLLSLSTLGFIYCNSRFMNEMLWGIEGSCQAYKISLKGILDYRTSPRMQKLFADKVADYVDIACASGEVYRTSLADFASKLFYKACEKMSRPLYNQRRRADTLRDYAHIQQAIQQMGNQGLHQKDSLDDFVREVFFSRGQGPVFLPLLAPPVPQQNPPIPAAPIAQQNPPRGNQRHALNNQVLQPVRATAAADVESGRLSQYKVGEVLLPYAIEAMREFFEEMQGVLPETFLAEFNPFDTADMQIAIGIFLTHILSRPELAEGLKNFELQKIENKRLCITDVAKQQETKQDREVFIRERYLTLLKIFIENHKEETSEEEQKLIQEAAPQEMTKDVKLLVRDIPAAITSSGGDTRLWSLLNDAWTEAFPTPSEGEVSGSFARYSF